MNTNQPRKNKILLVALPLLTLLCFIIGSRYGAVKITWTEIGNALSSVVNGTEQMGLNEKIFLNIRLPRSVMCLFTGAALAVGGVLLQALFRNPLLDPGLIGTSSGAAFGASLCLVVGSGLGARLSDWTLPACACAGGVISTLIVVLLSFSKETGKSNVITLLLVGIAVSALFMSGVGFMSYIARDPQARSITFWNMGTLSGSSWRSVTVTSVVFICCLVPALRLSKQLNALMMGEDEALYLGVNLRWLKWKVLLLNTLMVAVATSFVGVISFVGLIVPHLLRMFLGANNRNLLLAASFTGAVFLTLSDLLARTLLQPAELPIGIVTSVVGVPVFILLIRSNKYFF
jgi:iron complex transport system permease protein